MQEIKLKSLCFVVIDISATTMYAIGDCPEMNAV